MRKASWNKKEKAGGMIRPGLILPKQVWIELRLQSIREERTSSESVAQLIWEYIDRVKGEGKK